MVLRQASIVGSKPSRFGVGDFKQTSISNAGYSCLGGLNLSRRSQELQGEEPKLVIVTLDINYVYILTYN